MNDLSAIPFLRAIKGTSISVKYSLIKNSGDCSLFYYCVTLVAPKYINPMGCYKQTLSSGFLFPPTSHSKDNNMV